MPPLEHRGRQKKPAPRDSMETVSLPFGRDTPAHSPDEAGNIGPHSDNRKAQIRRVPERARRRSHSSGKGRSRPRAPRSEEHTSELQSLAYLVCRLLLEKKKRQRSPSN